MNADSLLSRLLQHGNTRPAQTALRCGERELTYAGLQQRVADLSQTLASLPPRSQVVLCSRDPLFFSSAFLALGASNHNALIFNPDWPPAMQTSLWQRLRPALWLGDQVPDWAEGLSQQQLLEPAIEPVDIQTLVTLCAERDTRALFYTGFTSGSSGVPKGFSRHEQSWLASFAADQQIFHFTAGDVFHSPGSLAHSLFLYAVMRALYAGATVVLAESFRASQTLAQISEDGGVLFAVPTQLLALAEAVSEPVPQLQKILSSGAKLQAETLSRVSQVFPQAEVFEFYGSSELSYISVADQQAPADSVGKPLPGVKVSIRDDGGALLGQGEKGLIYVESDLVFEGYAGPNGQVSRQGLSEVAGALSCRDVGYLDAEGYLFITGRADRMMLVSGRNVYPEEIEAVLLRYPGVRFAAVLGRADRLRGTRPVALLQSEQLLSRKALLDHCRGHLAPWSVPVLYYQVNEWPLTVSAKTDLPRLQTALAAGEYRPL